MWPKKDALSLETSETIADVVPVPTMTNGIPILSLGVLFTFLFKLENNCFVGALVFPRAILEFVIF